MSHVQGQVMVSLGHDEDRGSDAGLDPGVVLNDRIRKSSDAQPHDVVWRGSGSGLSDERGLRCHEFLERARSEFSGPLELGVLCGFGCNARAVVGFDSLTSCSYDCSPGARSQRSSDGQSEEHPATGAGVRVLLEAREPLPESLFPSGKSSDFHE